MPHVKLPMFPNRADKRVRLCSFSRRFEETLSLRWRERRKYCILVLWHTGTVPYSVSVRYQF